MFAPMRTIIYNQSRFLSPYDNCTKEQRKLVSEANRLLRKNKLSKKLAKKEKRVSS